MYNIYNHEYINENLDQDTIINLNDLIKSKIDNLIELSKDENRLIDNDIYNSINDILIELIDINKDNYDDIFDETEILNITVVEQIISIESSECGDYKSQYAIIDKENYTIDQFINLISDYGTIDYLNKHYDRLQFFSIDSIENYQNGDQVNYSIFINNKLSDKVRKIIIKKLKDKRLLS